MTPPSITLAAIRQRAGKNLNGRLTTICDVADGTIPGFKFIENGVRVSLNQDGATAYLKRTQGLSECRARHAAYECAGGRGHAGLHFTEGRFTVWTDAACDGVIDA